MTNLLRFETDLAILTDAERAALPFLDRAVSGIEQIYRNQLGEGPKANLYPADVTREELEEAALEDRALIRYDTVVRRATGSGRLVAVPYQIEYRDDLLQIVEDLRRAAALLPAGPFQTYVLARANALMDGAYDASDELWLDVHDSNLQLVIGPIETYIDRFMALKASYEGILAVRRPPSDKAFTSVTSTALALREELFADLKYSSDTRMQIEVDEIIVMAGHANANRMNAKTLPNSFAVIERKGSRKMLFASVIERRTDEVFTPIVELVFGLDGLGSSDLRQGGSLFLLSHELWHTLLMPDGFSRENVKESYTFLEEAKAHILGIMTVGELKRGGALSDKRYRAAVLAILGYLIADVRLGTHLPTRSAYKTAALMILGQLERSGCIGSSDAFPWSIDFERWSDASRDIASQYCDALGSMTYSDSRQLVEDAGEVEITLRQALARVAAVPITI